MKALLEAHPGWQVCGEASNGREAVQKAAELKPDVAVLDLAMPEMDGLEAACQISSASPEMPILIYTNLAVGPEAKLEAKKYGVREIINKGAAPEQLLSAVEALMKPPAVAAEAATAMAAINGAATAAAAINGGATAATATNGAAAAAATTNGAATAAGPATPETKPAETDLPPKPENGD
jgi:DNA-binding NarL/FixJ family response regulator